MDLETFDIETGSQPDAAVIWLHGLGADAHDFEPVVPALSLGADRAMRFVFPNAPVRPVTINSGMPMRAWFDLLALDRRAPEDETGIRESAAAIERLIKRENSRGIEASRIVLAGFSQGGAVALFTALRYQQALAGVIALSTYLPLLEVIKQERAAVNAALPIFLAHGLFDEIVDIALARGSRNDLEQLGYEVDWRKYPIPHSVCVEEIADIQSFLAAAF